MLSQADCVTQNKQNQTSKNLTCHARRTKPKQAMRNGPGWKKQAQVGEGGGYCLNGPARPTLTEQAWRNSPCPNRLDQQNLTYCRPAWSNQAGRRERAKPESRWQWAGWIVRHDLPRTMNQMVLSPLFGLPSHGLSRNLRSLNIYPQVLHLLPKAS